MTKLLRSHVGGNWHEGTGKRSSLFDPTTEDVLAESSTEGLDFGAAVDFARREGGPALRGMTFHQRGEMLQAMASALHEYRDELLDLARQNGGNTRGDAKFDVDGATGTLSAYAKIASGLDEGTSFFADGEPLRLARSPRFVGRHLLRPLHGVAIHVNAFNFPAWGFAEKAAVALLAGMPVITKPATSTALLAERMIEILVEGKVLPAGALSFIAGSVGDLLSHAGPQDVVAFTGSANTAYRIRSQENLLRQSVRVNVEADSLNAAVLAPDVESGTDTFDLFLREVARDVTQKAGQKCTAIRRVLIPESMIEEAREALGEEIARTKVGNPALREVRMGPLATKGQLEDVQAGIDKLLEQSELVFGEQGRGELVDVADGKGYFQAPVLLQVKDSATATHVHEHEVFGPVASLLPYSGDAADASALIAKGQGGLVSSIYTDDREFAATFLDGGAAFHGRLHFGSKKIAEHSMGPGTVLPQLVHGGPGRAGGGEELGGLRGLSLYLQRTAVQGDEPMIARLAEGGADW